MRAARAARPGREGLFIDSGAELHVCPPWYKVNERLYRSLESRCSVTASEACRQRVSKDALDPEATSIGIEQGGRTFEVHETKVS